MTRIALKQLMLAMLLCLSEGLHAPLKPDWGDYLACNCGCVYVLYALPREGWWCVHHSAYPSGLVEQAKGLLELLHLRLVPIKRK